MIDNEPIASISMAADYLGVSRMTIYTWRKRGILPEYHFGIAKRVCFKWSDLKALKATHTASFTTMENEDE